MATLDEVARKYRWDKIHDYKRDVKQGGRFVAIYGLGLYEEDAKAVAEALPTRRLRCAPRGARQEEE